MSLNRVVVLGLGKVGSLVGTLGCGWWWMACKKGDRADWPLFWGVLAALTAAVFVFFALNYRGRKAGTA